MAKHSYNSKLKAYRRHTSPDNLEQVQTAYKEYTKLYEEELRQKTEQRRDSLHTLCHMKRKTHYVTQRCSPENLQERTNNILTNMVPDRVLTVTTATYEAVDADQEFTISELEDVLDRLKDTAPGDDTVCYSMIKHTPLSTRHLFLRLINQSFSEGRLPTRWTIAKIIPIPKKDKTHRPISLLSAFSIVMERLVLARVKWSAQPINPYSLGFRSRVGAIEPSQH